VIAAKLRVRAGAEADAARTFASLTPPSRAEPGCLAYQAHVDPTDPSTFFIYEHWADDAALELHRRTEHYVRWAPALADLVQERDVLLLEPL
jgi:quinol monooxygenase YgiN